MPNSEMVYMKIQIQAICLILITSTCSYAMANEVKCQQEVDRVLQVLNLGSFDHPSTCTNKTPTGNVTKFGLGKCPYPAVEYIENKGLITVSVSTKDAEGKNMTKLINYDEDCKVKKISYKTEGREPVLLDGKVCGRFLEQASISNKVGIYNPNAGIVTTCVSHIFSNPSKTDNDKKEPAVNETKQAK